MGKLFAILNLMHLTMSSEFLEPIQVTLNFGPIRGLNAPSPFNHSMEIFILQKIRKIFIFLAFPRPKSITKIVYFWKFIFLYDFKSFSDIFWIRQLPAHARNNFIFCDKMHWNVRQLCWKYLVVSRMCTMFPESKHA